jgi:hypothetical protein
MNMIWHYLHRVKSIETVVTGINMIQYDYDFIIG